MVTKKNNNNSLIKSQQPKINNFNKKNNRTLIIGSSICWKTYLMNYFLLQKQEPIVILTKSLNQYPKIKGETSDENQQLRIYENSSVVFDGLLLLKQERNINLLFLQEDVKIISIFTINLKTIFTSQ